MLLGDEYLPWGMAYCAISKRCVTPQVYILKLQFSVEEEI